MFYVGIDVGGTFTDVVVFDEERGEVRVGKVPTTPADPTEGVMRGLREAGVDLGQVQRLIHGTTMATNAIIEKKGAKTAFITTKGFKDTLEIGDTHRYTGGLFDHRWVRVRPYVPRHLRFEVRERMLYTGEPATRLSEEDVLAVIEELKKHQVEAVAVGFLNSYKNGEHEKRVGQLLEANLPGVPVSLSMETVPEFREFPRFSTAWLNAYIAPRLKGYLTRLSSALHREGYRSEIFYMISSGGIVTEGTAAAYPIRFILSGPAGGVSAGVSLGKALGQANILTFDMGGTSTDVCLVKDFKALVSYSRVIVAFPIATSQLDVNTIGAGGGSIAWVDPNGLLKVGPQSAGAVPGPACYGLGGAEVTVTDANLVLGRIGPSSLLGGRMTLKQELAEKALRDLADKIQVADIHQVAEGILHIINVAMSGAIRALSIERGYDPRDLALVAGGGAGPMHALALAQAVGIRRVIVPSNPGNFSALGLLTSDMRHDYVRSYITEVREADLSRVKALLKEMEDEGCQALLSERMPAERIEISYTLGMRYVGQSFELDIPVSGYDFELSDLVASFHRAYAETYGYSREEMEVELVNLRVSVSGRVDKPTLRTVSAQPGPLSQAVKEHRQVYFGGAFLPSPVYCRELLPQGVSLSGPAVIEEFSSTTVVFPGWRATVDPWGHLVLELEGGQ